jgi:hypothetical protein
MSQPEKDFQKVKQIVSGVLGIGGGVTAYKLYKILGEFVENSAFCQWILFFFKLELPVSHINLATLGGCLFLYNYILPYVEKSSMYKYAGYAGKRMQGVVSTFLQLLLFTVVIFLKSQFIESGYSDLIQEIVVKFVAVKIWELLIKNRGSVANVSLKGIEKWAARMAAVMEQAKEKAEGGTEEEDPDSDDGFFAAKSSEPAPEDPDSDEGYFDAKGWEEIVDTVPVPESLSPPEESDDKEEAEAEAEINTILSYLNPASIAWFGNLLSFFSQKAKASAAGGKKRRRSRKQQKSRGRKSLRRRTRASTARHALSSRRRKP